MNTEIIKQAAEKEIACHPDQKNIRFKIDDTIFWIKRKYSNKRNRLVKQPPETEFLFEVARIAIAAKACPGLVPQIEVLTSEYMVTRDGGPTIEDWMEDPNFTFEEKKESSLPHRRVSCRTPQCGCHPRPSCAAGYPVQHRRKNYVSRLGKPALLQQERNAENTRFPSSSPRNLQNKLRRRKRLAGCH